MSHLTNWVIAFMRKVILLFQNLPEEGSETIPSLSDDEGM